MFEGKWGGGGEKKVGDASLQHFGVTIEQNLYQNKKTNNNAQDIFFSSHRLYLKMQFSSLSAHLASV